jgi:hypothetical protein
VPAAPGAGAGSPAGAAQDDPQAQFDRETRDQSWAPPREEHLRVRLERLARLTGGDKVLRVECRASCCQIDYDDGALTMEELQTSAGIPFGSGAVAFMEDRIVSCYRPGDVLPPEDFVDRLDERIALDPTLRAAEARCATLDGTPGTARVGVVIGPSGAFRLALSGDMTGTTAAGCLEDFLYENLRFSPAPAGSDLDVTLRLKGP